MGYWAVLLPVERYEAERLLHHETVDLPRVDEGRPPVDGRAAGPVPDDQAFLVAASEPPLIFGLARFRSRPGDGGGEGGPLSLTYIRRFLDAPQPAKTLALDGALTPLDEEAFFAQLALLPPPADRRTWLVSVNLPIEAESAGEAVREFWAYVLRLGPRELPAFVAPLGDELAMQAYVLGEQANLDPEEDEE